MGRLQANGRQFLDIPLANGHANSAPLSQLTTTREEATRKQLQRQRLSEQQHAVVVSQKIPGFKTSAGM